jgi:hypothetical protein
MEFLHDEQLDMIRGGALLALTSPSLIQITGGSAVATGGPSQTLLGAGTGNAAAFNTTQANATLTSVLVSLF